MTDRQILRNLRNCELFSALSGSELKKIAASVLEKDYEAGTTLFHEGDNADELFVLQEGKLAVQMTASRALGQKGRRVTVDIVTRNEMIDWSAIVEPYVYTLTAICLQKVKVLSISANNLRWLLQGNSNVGYEVMKELIKVVASRLDDTRQVLASERLLTSKLG